MITRPTVLVLGAGASAPYDYPTGKRLIKIVVENFKNEELRGQIKAALSESASVKEKFLDRFIESLIKSASLSVDTFLEYRPEFIDLGKLAITQALINCEKEEVLHEKNDWYHYLFNNLNTTLEEFPKNNLSVITFNYDRSLEQFLFTSLVHRYNASPTKSKECLESIPILHVHGQIGPLPWQDKKNGREYKREYTIEELRRSSGNIRIISEQEAPTDKLFNDAVKLINQAEKVYFLGFGYHKVNLDRLKIGELAVTANKEIIGTCHGFTTKEIANVKVSLSEGKISLLPEYRYHEILEFLRRYATFD